MLTRVLLIVAVLSHGALAALRTVTSSADSGAGSLRSTIASALPGDTIQFGLGVSGKTIVLTTGQLVINKDLTIAGPGADKLTISGNHTSRVFLISGAVKVNILDVTISDGNGTGPTTPGTTGTGSTPGTLANSGASLTTTGSRTLTSLGAGTGSIYSGTLTVNGGSVITTGTGTLTFTGGTPTNTGTITTGGTLVITGNSSTAGGTTGISLGGGGILPGPITVPTFAGGGIYNDRAALTLSRCVITGNATRNGFEGGGIYNRGGEVIVCCTTIAGNTAGGGIVNDASVIINNGQSSVSGSLSVFGSTISGNHGTRAGGIKNGILGTVTVTNSTIAGNTGVFGAGAIYNGARATLSLNNCTIAGNSGPITPPAPAGGGAVLGAGGVFLDNGLISILNGPGRVSTMDSANTIFSNNAGGNFARSTISPSTSGTALSRGYNLSDDSTLTAFFNTPGDLNNTPAGLQLDASGKPALADNGGFTDTIALLPDSAAINHGDPGFDPDTFTPPLLNDQRGFNRVLGGRLDIGAFEAATPRGLAFGVRDTLRTLLPTGDKKTDKRVWSAIHSLTESTDQALWEDEFRLARKGRKVFEEHQDAVRELGAIVKADGPASIAAQNAIDHLLSIDASLAQIAIDDATSTHGDPKEIARAQADFAAGMQAADANNDERAIERFKHAWDHARRAVKKIPGGEEFDRGWGQSPTLDSTRHSARRLETLTAGTRLSLCFEG